MKTDTTKGVSALPTHRTALSEVPWEEVSTPGAYVEIGTGDLFRFTQESIKPGLSPVVHKESSGASRLARISEDPYVLSQKARLICVQNDIQPNF